VRVIDILTGLLTGEIAPFNNPERLGGPVVPKGKAAKTVSGQVLAAGVRFRNVINVQEIHKTHWSGKILPHGLAVFIALK
jgi:hypothetical protein